MYCITFPAVKPKPRPGARAPPGTHRPRLSQLPSLRSGGHNRGGASPGTLPLPGPAGSSHSGSRRDRGGSGDGGAAAAGGAAPACLCRPGQRPPAGQRGEVGTRGSACAPGAGGGFRVTAPHKAAGCVASPGGRRARSTGLPGVPRREGVARGDPVRAGASRAGLRGRGLSHSPRCPKPASSCLRLGRAEVSWGGGCTWHSGGVTSHKPGEDPRVHFHSGLQEPRRLEEGPHSGIPPRAVGTHPYGGRTPFLCSHRSRRNPLA